MGRDLSKAANYVLSLIPAQERKGVHVIDARRRRDSVRVTLGTGDADIQSLLKRLASLKAIVAESKIVHVYVDVPNNTLNGLLLLVLLTVGAWYAALWTISSRRGLLLA
jgi:hypothetical protein